MDALQHFLKCSDIKSRNVSNRGRCCRSRPGQRRSIGWFVVAWSIFGCADTCYYIMISAQCITVRVWLCILLRHKLLPLCVILVPTLISFQATFKAFPRSTVPAAYGLYSCCRAQCHGLSAIVRCAVTVAPLSCGRKSAKWKIGMVQERGRIASVMDQLHAACGPF